MPPKNTKQRPQQMLYEFCLGLGLILELTRWSVGGAVVDTNP